MESHIIEIVDAWINDKSSIFDGRLYWDFDDADNWLKTLKGKSEKTIEIAKKVILRFKYEQKNMVERSMLKNMA